MQKMAIFGGTFDPIHWGHLLIAEAALNQVDLDQVIWVPTRFPLHKSKLTQFDQRWAMLSLAIADHSAFRLSPLQSDRLQPDFAIQTLTDLQNIYPQSKWYWIIGLDAFQSLPQWYQHNCLASACDWLVAPRWKFSEKEVIPESLSVNFLCEQVAQKFAHQNTVLHWQILQMPPNGLSSSLIRDYCRDRRSIRYLVPDPVRIYIATHQLYAD
jgi:nicotinate-nucleotide adenylyltransferase